MSRHGSASSGHLLFTRPERRRAGFSRCTLHVVVGQKVIGGPGVPPRATVPHCHGYRWTHMSVPVDFSKAPGHAAAMRNWPAGGIVLGADAVGRLTVPVGGVDVLRAR